MSGENPFEGLRLDRLTSTQKLIMVALRSRPDGLFTTDLRYMLKIAPAAISRSVGYLLQKQLVTREVRGKERFYRLGGPSQ